MNERFKEIIVEANNLKGTTYISTSMTFTSVRGWQITATVVTFPIIETLGEELYNLVWGRSRDTLSKDRRNILENAGLALNKGLEHHPPSPHQRCFCPFVGSSRGWARPAGGGAGAEAEAAAQVQWERCLSLSARFAFLTFIFLFQCFLSFIILQGALPESPLLFSPCCVCLHCLC